MSTEDDLDGALIIGTTYGEFDDIGKRIGNIFGNRLNTPVEYVQTPTFAGPNELIEIVANNKFYSFIIFAAALQVTNGFLSAFGEDLYKIAKKAIGYGETDVAFMMNSDIYEKFAAAANYTQSIDGTIIFALNMNDSMGRKIGTTLVERGKPLTAEKAIIYSAVMYKISNSIGLITDIIRNNGITSEYNLHGSINIDEKGSTEIIFEGAKAFVDGETDRKICIFIYDPHSGDIKLKQ